MADKELKTVPKITVKIWRPIIDKLESNLDSQCLRRDAYLAKVLGVELDHLDAEVSIPNSQASYDYVLDELDRLDRKPVSLALPPDLTKKLNAICDRKRIVRDAFFNRLFLLLAISPRLIDKFIFGGDRKEWHAIVWKELGHRDIFENHFYPLNDAIDPFWFIRQAFEIYARTSRYEDYVEPTTGETVQVERSVTGEITPVDSFYTTLLDQTVSEHKLLGLNCYVPDSAIPGTEANKARLTLDDILGF